MKNIFLVLSAVSFISASYAAPHYRGESQAYDTGDYASCKTNKSYGKFGKTKKVKKENHRSKKYRGLKSDRFDTSMPSPAMDPVASPSMGFDTPPSPAMDPEMASEPSLDFLDDDFNDYEAQDRSAGFTLDSDSEPYDPNGDIK